MNIISIHTSAREVTYAGDKRAYCRKISIHTSAREVTQHKTKVQNIFSHFNPHFRKGSDGYLSDIQLYGSYFNPHFRKGSDMAKKCLIRFILYFNPHFRKGSDRCQEDNNHLTKQYFNPHFRKGSDPVIINLCSFSTLFQSTLPQGK